MREICIPAGEVVTRVDGGAVALRGMVFVRAKLVGEREWEYEVNGTTYRWKETA